jgi:hypothetical protein
MNFPLTHPLWMWLYFGFFGTAGIIFFTLTVWSWAKYRALLDTTGRSAALWSGLGFMFLFFAQWFACGIGGPPGNMLSPDPLAHNSFGALGAASLSMFFSVPGWVCVFISQKKLLKNTLERKRGSQ